MMSRTSHWILLAAGTLLVMSACGRDTTPVGPLAGTTPGSRALRTSIPFSPGSGSGALRPAAAPNTDCVFQTKGDRMELQADCTTDGTIVIPDGMTLDGKKHTITGVDPAGGHFVGAVVMNGGSTAWVRNLGVTVSGLTNACDEGGDRLRGIMFDGASGSIENNTIDGINQGPSGCQEGNAIEVRNAPFDGTHPATRVVLVSHNRIDAFQKTGIVANGDVDATISHNDLGPSATQNNLAANGIQVGFGGIGHVDHNKVAGNQWLARPGDYATAILIYGAGAVEASHNKIDGNSDIGIAVAVDMFGYVPDGGSTGGVYDHNDAKDEGPDGINGDIGMQDETDGLNTFDHNKVCGFDQPYDGVHGDKNKSC